MSSGKSGGNRRKAERVEGPSGIVRRDFLDDAASNAMTEAAIEEAHRAVHSLDSGSSRDV